MGSVPGYLVSTRTLSLFESFSWFRPLPQSSRLPKIGTPGPILFEVGLKQEFAIRR